jgi:hypothetical protein
MVQWMVQSRLRRRRVVSRQLRHQRRLLAVSEPSPGARKRKWVRAHRLGGTAPPSLHLSGGPIIRSRDSRPRLNER